eukprot:2339329-Pyramimonas_sp.AAC.1
MLGADWSCMASNGRVWHRLASVAHVRRLLAMCPPALAIAWHVFYTLGIGWSCLALVGRAWRRLELFGDQPRCLALV